MSRIGKQPIHIPNDVSVSVVKDQFVAKGTKGTLKVLIENSISIDITSNSIIVSPKDTLKNTKAMWGLVRSLINNAVTGVSKGFSKNLEIHGVGYKATVNSGVLILSLGYSHDIVYPITNDVSIKCLKNVIEVTGCDKQIVGQVCANIRSLRKPEPYKGKGIRYQNEVVSIKEGKKK